MGLLKVLQPSDCLFLYRRDCNRLILGLISSLLPGTVTPILTSVLI